jgi:hypothetical protein
MGSPLIGATRGAGKELLSFFSDLDTNSALLIAPSPVPNYPELDSPGQPIKVTQLHNGSGGKTLRRKPSAMNIEKSTAVLCRRMAFINSGRQHPLKSNQANETSKSTSNNQEVV